MFGASISTCGRSSHSLRVTAGDLESSSCPDDRGYLVRSVPKSLPISLTHTCVGVETECKCKRGHGVAMGDYANVLVNDFAVSDN